MTKASPERVGRRANKAALKEGTALANGSVPGVPPGGVIEHDPNEGQAPAAPQFVTPKHRLYVAFWYEKHGGDFGMTATVINDQVPFTHEGQIASVQQQLMGANPDLKAVTLLNWHSLQG